MDIIQQFHGDIAPPESFSLDAPLESQPLALLTSNKTIDPYTADTSNKIYKPQSTKRLRRSRHKKQRKRGQKLEAISGEELVKR